MERTMIAGFTHNRTGEGHAMKRVLPNYPRYLHRDE